MLSCSQWRGGKKEVEEEEKQSKAAAGGYQGGGGYEPLLAVEGCSEHPSTDPHPPDTLVQTQGPPLLAGWATSKFAGEYIGTPHAHLVWGGLQPLTPPPAAGTRHMGCNPWSRSSHNAPQFPPWLEVKDPPPHTHSLPSRIQDRFLLSKVKSPFPGAMPLMPRRSLSLSVCRGLSLVTLFVSLLPGL